MTVEEFANHVLGLRDNLYTALRTNLPAGCDLVKRYIINTEQDDQGWIAGLRNKDTKKVRLCAILPAELSLGDLSGTAGGRNFTPSHKISLELYHEYSEVVRDDNNSEDEFIRDAARIVYTLGQVRALSGAQGLIARASFKLGIRPSKIQTLHKSVGEIIVNMTDVRYEPLT